MKSLMAMFLVLFAVACNQMEDVQPSLENELIINSNSSLFEFNESIGAPIFWEGMRGPVKGGNLECSDLPNSYAFTTGRNNYDPVTGTFEKPWPAGFTVNVINNKFVEWSYTAPDANSCLGTMAVIVKGGPGHNVYTINGATSGSGLTAPLVGKGNIADLSNLTFCYNLVPCQDEAECENDTAFAGESGQMLNNKGWYYLMTLDHNYSATNTLWAGQNKAAGTVSIHPKNGNSNILVVEINLAAGFTLQTGDNWYVHGYTSAPSERPKGGQQGSAVTWSKGEASSAPITVEVNRNSATIFAVHVNVKECK
ncbi:hypothetical protein CLV48_101423 [Cecembia rubra]|uniref:Uncharacterized protein n=2 Tax=Cecembia rubra TaxID=1485585 RepID=A0A2P8EDF8_9BACT|nr:hypothetical protein CLV48_101423 [Cecembia rubra]